MIFKEATCKASFPWRGFAASACSTKAPRKAGLNRNRRTYASSLRVLDGCAHTVIMIPRSTKRPMNTGAKPSASILKPEGGTRNTRNAAKQGDLTDCWTLH